MDKKTGLFNFLGRGYKLCGLKFLKFFYNNGSIIAMLAAAAVALFAKRSVAMYPTQDVVGYVFHWMK